MGLGTTTFQGRGHALGAAVGQRFREPIRASLARHEARQPSLRAFARSAAGRALFTRLLALHRDRFALYVSEIEGLAEGAGVAFDTLFIVNLGAAYGAAAFAAGEPGCTTCSLSGPGQALIGHNVDGVAGEFEQCYFIRVEPGDGVPFTALCRAGVLPGIAFGFNDHGLCITGNDLRPDTAGDGAGRAFLSRALLAARTIDDALACLHAQPCGEGFTCTLGSRSERRIVSVEISPGAVSVHEVATPRVHANHYLDQDLAQQIGAASRARQRRGDALLAQHAPVSGQDVLRVLRDQGDREWPIWRDGTAPDSQTTLFSALFDLDRGALRIYPGATRHAADPNVPLAAAPIPGR